MARTTTSPSARHRRSASRPSHSKHGSGVTGAGLGVDDRHRWHHKRDSSDHQGRAEAERRTNDQYELLPRHRCVEPTARRRLRGADRTESPDHRHMRSSRATSGTTRRSPMTPRPVPGTSTSTGRSTRRLLASAFQPQSAAPSMPPSAVADLDGHGSRPQLLLPGRHRRSSHLERCASAVRDRRRQEPGAHHWHRACLRRLGSERGHRNDGRELDRAR